MKGFSRLLRMLETQSADSLRDPTHQRSAEGTKVVNAAEKPAEKKAPVEADDVALTETSKKVVEELDLKLHDQILSEKQDEEKQK